MLRTFSYFLLTMNLMICGGGGVEGVLVFLLEEKCVNGAVTGEAKGSS